MRNLAPFTALALAAAPLPAAACSVASGYRVPTNLELVEGADLILLGKVTSGDFAPDSTPQQMIAVEPIAVLKGDRPAAPIALAASIAPGDDAILSNPYELNEAHPQSFAGACTRTMFPDGSRVLFFLRRQGGEWHEAGGPFSRWAEDVMTDDAPWLQLVRFYADVAARPAADRTAALIARRDELGAQGADPVAQLMAADIQRQLDGPNRPLKDALPPPPQD
ncbi:MAG: hypothetical protein JNM03_03720 [Sphingopyxis sp.]|uniref:hypothetical protein n=1 Tax=Sphingopyxis sp. TaxID=1908224 RepID=UPI001A5C7F92|nr:hypothetical protein [Sphingopyxis sp.]MBL9069077.1 hypothetical protein [Sphingopyxis sp.]